ncbi:MAG: hypothetical protein ACOCZ3_00955 [Bacillota bacterium]
MITYYGIDLVTKRGSTFISLQQDREIIHIPFTNVNEKIDRGRKPAVITTTIITMSEGETNDILVLLNSDITGSLQVGHKLFKRVISAGENTPSPQKRDKKDVWHLKATFMALDPIPYDAETGEAIYG